MCLTTFFKKLLRLTSPVKAVQINTDPFMGQTVVIDVKPRARGLQCGDCGRRCSRRHGAEGKLRSWRHLGLFGFVVLLRCRVYRVVCKRCGVHPRVRGVRASDFEWKQPRRRKPLVWRHLHTLAGLAPNVEALTPSAADYRCLANRRLSISYASSKYFQTNRRERALNVREGLMIVRHSVLAASIRRQASWT